MNVSLLGNNNFLNLTLNLFVKAKEKGTRIANVISKMNPSEMSKRTNTTETMVRLIVRDHGQCPFPSNEETAGVH